MQYIYDNSLKCFNAEYRAEKLKEQLASFFGKELTFWLPSNNNRSQLVYSSRLSTGEAVEAAFESATSEKKLEEAASILRKSITDQYEKSKSTEMPWPPSAEYLEKLKDLVPDILTDFLLLVISNRPSSKCSATVLRKCTSLSEDICSATTRGQWKMPKHLLHSLSVHQLTGSFTLITMLNRYGHCQSYSQTLELETAMAVQDQLQGCLLPSNISLTGNIVTHFCWDNFDINEETPSGSGTTHTQRTE